MKLNELNTTTTRVLNVAAFLLVTKHKVSLDNQRNFHQTNKILSNSLRFTTAESITYADDSWDAADAGDLVVLSVTFNYTLFRNSAKNTKGTSQKTITYEVLSSEKHLNNSS